MYRQHSNYQAVQRRIQEIARAREEARRKHEEAKRKAAVNPLQALWDANGAAIYAANQAFKTAYGRNMSASVRRKAIKDATVNGHFSAGAYAGNLVKAATPPTKEEDPYAEIGDWVDRQDKSNAKMLDEASELEKWAALQKQKGAPVDSAIASYMAMGAAVEAGKFDKEDYDKARKQAREDNCPWWNLSCHAKKIGNTVSTFWQDPGNAIFLSIKRKLSRLLLSKEIFQDLFRSLGHQQNHPNLEESLLDA